MQKKTREIKSSGKTDQAPFGSKYKHCELPSVKWILLFIVQCILTWFSLDVLGNQDLWNLHTYFFFYSLTAFCYNQI